MAHLTTFITAALLLSASVVSGRVIHLPLDTTYTPTDKNQEAHRIAAVNGHHQPLIPSELSSPSSSQTSVQVCITIDGNPDGTREKICAEHPDDLCYDPVWKVVPRPAHALPWCAPEEPSMELKRKSLIARQGGGGSGGATSLRRRKVEERGAIIPGPKLPAPETPGPVVPRTVDMKEKRVEAPGPSIPGPSIPRALVKRGLIAPGPSVPGPSVPGPSVPGPAIP